MKDETILQWYKEHKIVADRIINDLRDRSCGAVMHMYAYTSKSLQLEHIVSQRDFPSLFTNNYTRVGDRLMGFMGLLLGKGNAYLRPDYVRRSLKYWLLYGDLYETLVSKIIIKAEESQERVKKNGWLELKKQLIATSIQNSIKSQEEWNRFFQDEDAQVDEDIKEPYDSDNRVSKEIPVELQSEEAQIYLKRAIELGLCDNDFTWKESSSLLAYFAESVSDKLKLSSAMQDDKMKTSWKPFESLFGRKGLAGFKNNYINKTGKLPGGYEIVDSMFKPEKKIIKKLLPM